MDQFDKQTGGELTAAGDILVKRSDGSVVYADVNAFLITLDGRTYLMGIFSDITERKKAEDALRKSEWGLILDGKSNKQIAHVLHCTLRTIEWHRSYVMHKLGVNNTVDLVKRAGLMGLVELPANRQ